MSPIFYDLIKDLYSINGISMVRNTYLMKINQ